MQSENFELTHKDRFDRIEELPEDERYLWFKKEREYWEEISISAKNTNSDGYYRSIIQRYLLTIEGMIDNSSDITAFKDFQLENTLPFHDEYPHSEHIRESARRGLISLSLYIFSSLTNQQSAIYTSKYKSQLSDLEESLKKAMINENEKYKSSLSESESTFHKLVETTKKELTDQLKEKLDKATAEIESTVTTATNAVLSAEPVKYWEERETKHRLKARSYRYGVIGAAIAFLSTLVFLTLSVYKDGETYTIFKIPFTLPAEKFSIALLVIATTAAIWLIRILVKLMMTNLALEIEALERSTMIKTYIAIDSTKAEQAAEVRMLFYTTLFRPSNNTLADDSTSPEYIRIIEAMLQKKP